MMIFALIFQFFCSEINEYRMDWIQLTDVSLLNQIDEESNDKYVLIFKHSTRCNISATALSRLQRKWDKDASEQLTPYYLDLLSYRDVSNEIADRYNIRHQSPQVLIIHKGKCVYDASHMEIDLNEIQSQLHAHP